MRQWSHRYQYEGMNSADGDMKDLVDGQLGAFGVPGAAVAVVHDGDVVLCGAFGLADVGGARPVTTNTSFAIASTTKAFTAAAVAALVDDGLVEWDTPVRHYLPDFELRDHVATERLTPRDLLCHRSGLPRHDMLWYGNPSEDRGELVRALRHVEPSADFRQTFQYNNTMYATAGHLIEVVTGETWETFLRARLLEPLGMRQTTCSYEEAGEIGPVAVPYAGRGEAVVQMPSSPNSRLCGPAGSIYSPIEDMVYWLSVHLDGGTRDGRTVLSAAATRELLAPQMVQSSTALFPEAADSAYGLGWFIGTYRGHLHVHHGGNIDGFTSLVTMLPDERAGVVVLCNRDLTPFCDALTYSVYDRLLGLEPLPWVDRIRTSESASWAGSRAATARLPRRENAPPTHPLEEYVGDYVHPAYGTFGISVADGVLVPTYRLVPMTLKHRHFDVWDADVGIRERSPKPLTFRTDPRGDISALEIPLEPAVAPIVFQRAPDARLTEPAFLTSLVGRYACGPLEISVEQATPGTLSATLPTAGQVTLVATRGTTFRVATMPTVTFTFELDDSGAVQELVVQPAGIFLPVS